MDATSIIGTNWQRYAEYKDSGEEWLGMIPQHWEAGKLWGVASVKARLGWRGLKASEYVDEGYIFLSTPNIKPKYIDFENINYITAERYFESPEIMLQEGDVLIAKDGSTLGITNVIRKLPAPATVNSSIAVIRPKKILDSVFLFYFLLSDYIQSIVQLKKGGMGVPHLFQSDLRKFSVLIPPTEEQQAISIFLDHETAKIDALIAKKEHLIELLQEKRAAIISYAMTKGLDPNVPMKDSGVEWLGEIPAHWDIKRLKRIAGLRAGFAITSDIIEDTGEYPVFGGNGIRGFTSSYTHEGDSPIIGRQGALCGCINFAQGKFWASEHAVVATTKPDVNPHWLMYLLQSMSLNRYSESAAQPGLAVETISSLHMCLPPNNEQNNIANFLRYETENNDSLSLKINKSIEKLKEYRTALISAAVTGKIDVRDEVYLGGTA
jgi:type I restriction enzyme S subunit